MEPLERYTLSATGLMKNFPPQWQGRNKLAVFKIASSSGYPFEGTIEYARWPKRDLPATVNGTSAFEARPDFFDYVPSKMQPAFEWHLNFADSEIFVAYESSLLAQDELQVAEHPALGSLRDAFYSKGITPLTVAIDGSPTPVTITGVQRRCFIDTSPNPGEGRPYGLYGNEFARAYEEDVIAATHAIKPPTISNILAMAAIPCNEGRYTMEEISLTLVTAFSGYSAARDEARQIAGADTKVIIHTGFWGCGAYGGNHTLMTMLQALAAELAGVDLVFHAGNDHGVQVAKDAYDTYRRIKATVSDTDNLVTSIYDMNFEWNESDGN
jgi:hypothetical protein